MYATTKKTPKNRSEQERSRTTKSLILRAALAEFAAAGFEGASTRGIAGRADVNHTLISHHFGNKDALWKATAQWVFETYTQLSINRRDGLRGIDPSVLVKVLLKDFILFCAEMPDFHRFMMQANQGDSQRLIWLADRFLRPGAETELDVLKQAQHFGFLPAGDTLHMRYLFIGAATSIFTFAAEFERLSDTDPYSAAVLERHVEYVLSLFSTNTKKN